VVRLREQPLQVYTLGLGVSANTGPRASVEHLYRRVFGFAASSRVKIELGVKRQAWTLRSAAHPVEGCTATWSAARSSGCCRTPTSCCRSGCASAARRTHSARTAVFRRAERSLRKTDAGDRNNAFAVSLNFHGGWRDLDSVLLPTDGETLAIQLAWAARTAPTPAAGYFGRAYGRLTVYRPLGRTWYGQARHRAGPGLPAPNMVVPDSQLWRAGGDDSVRGYSYRSLGPLVDGAVGSGIR
jgi:translocation and assembly module TamA